MLVISSFFLSLFGYLLQLLEISYSYQTKTRPQYHNRLTTIIAPALMGGGRCFLGFMVVVDV